MQDRAKAQQRGKVGRTKEQRSRRKFLIDMQRTAKRLAKKKKLPTINQITLPKRRRGGAQVKVESVDV